jgi:drug/metabolite transporter (DMT)-like permease
MSWFFVSLYLSIAIGAFAQIILKEGAIRPPAILPMVPITLNLYVLAGLSTYAVSSLFYLHAIKQVPLSVAFPSVSLSYVVVAFFAHLIWGERFGWPQVVALGLISSGIFILTRKA